MLMSSLFGVRVELKSLAIVMSLTSSVLMLIPLYAAHSLTFAQYLKDEIFYSFGAINTPISCLLFPDSALFISFSFFVVKLNFLFLVIDECQILHMWTP
jgi:hypothetical protein